MLIILVDAVEPEPQAQGWSASGLQRAIATLQASAGTRAVQIIPMDKGQGGYSLGSSLESGEELVWCPMTTAGDLQTLPEPLRSHPLLALAIRCGDVDGFRQTVAQELEVEVGDGTVWLPLVVTARGPLYGEAIAQGSADAYEQPFHLSDRQRQTVYRFAHRVLQWVDAPPAVYLLQLGLTLDGKDLEKLWFDRLLPFPGEPAIASIGIQTPDLFECHWRCLTGQPIRDITIG